MNIFTERILMSDIWMKYITWFFMIIFVGAGLAQDNDPANVANNTTPGTLTQYSTIHSIGFEWDISGDDNHNALCQVDYRVAGSNDWKDAQPLFRIDFEGENALSGSILFLEPATTYEVRLSLSDIDGGSDTRTVTIATRPIPAMPTGGDTYHVIPGSGGGNGSAANPFQGISAAQNAAQPGDIFLLHAGNYGNRKTFDVAGDPGNYIVWKAAGDGEAIFDGIDIRADWVWIEGLKIVANGNSLRSRNSPDNVVISRNTFINCHYCIDLDGGGSDWYIVDNDITGDVDPASETFGGEGIELQHTDGHTVAYNRISRVADGISYPNRNVDIFGNDIFDTSDDGIEGDYGRANIRIWGNRISNVFHNGISFQPMNGSPWYVLYNQIAAPEEDALKLRDRTDRVLLAHNTLVAWTGPVKSESHRLRTFQSNNNIWISVADRYIWENSGDHLPTWRTNLDYDGFDWGNYDYAFKWGSGNRYRTLQDFQNATGMEMNGIQVDRNAVFDTFNIPGPPPMPVPFQFMTLAAGSNAIDAGIALANINDGYNGSAPDLGAYEYGQVLPHYGPRPAGTTGLDNPAPVLAKAFTLNQNYPNPFNPETVIRYSLSGNSAVVLDIFSVTGERVRRLVGGESQQAAQQQSGEYLVVWDGRNDNGVEVGSGVYFYRLRVGEQSQTRRMQLVR